MPFHPQCIVARLTVRDLLQSQCEPDLLGERRRWDFLSLACRATTPNRLGRLGDMDSDGTYSYTQTVPPESSHVVEVP